MCSQHKPANVTEHARVAHTEKQGSRVTTGSLKCTAFKHLDCLPFSEVAEDNCSSNVLLWIWRIGWLVWRGGVERSINISESFTCLFRKLHSRRHAGNVTDTWRLLMTSSTFYSAPFYLFIIVLTLYLYFFCNQEDIYRFLFYYKKFKNNHYNRVIKK